MRNLTAEIRAFLRDEEGVTMIEYVLIAALVAVALITFWKQIEKALETILTKISEELNRAAGTGGG